MNYMNGECVNFLSNRNCLWCVKEIVSNKLIHGVCFANQNMQLVLRKLRFLSLTSGLSLCPKDEFFN